MTDIRPMRDNETEAWGRLRHKLWPDCPPSESAAEAAEFLAGHSAVKLVLFALENETAIGFAEISERSVVDGCEGAQAYLEGWYVAPEYQGKGVGGALIAAAAVWARAAGYDYLGSDAELDNLVSQKAHAALGFKETGRVVTYIRAVTA